MEDMMELSFGELGALCSNLANACTKQLRSEEASLFTRLSDYYTSRSKAAAGSQFGDLVSLAERDLSTLYPEAVGTVTGENDRGALRALVWGEKVTKLLKSLLGRYGKQKDALLENTNVYVCLACGFVYVGEEPPEICPICKAPKAKLVKVEKEVK
jgi:rubrerythrin